MKQIKKTLFTLISCLLLTGCVNCNMNIRINDTENAEFTVDMLVSDQSLYSVDDIKDKFMADNDLMKDWSFKNLSKTINDEEYNGFTMTAPSSQIKTILDHVSTSKKNDKTIYTLELTNTELGNIDTSELNNYTSTISALQGQGAKFDLIVEMPGDIISSNIGKIKDNTVTINMFNYLTGNELQSIKIISNDKESDYSLYIYLAVGLAIIILVIAIYLSINKRKNRKHIQEQNTNDIRCPHCNNIINEDDKKCPICGYELK